MTKKPQVSIFKPDLGAALNFASTKSAELPSSPPQAAPSSIPPPPPKAVQTPSKQVSGLVPEGDVRLTANISEAHHIKLKVAAAKQRTTIGELIEKMIDKLQ